jgi:cyanophycinase-like exopeptidase
VHAAPTTATGIFLPGGDQSTYIDFWSNTRVQTDLNAAPNPANKSAVMGGDSAGLAVMGQIAYKSGRTERVLKSSEATTDPYTKVAQFDQDDALVKDFLTMPVSATKVLANVVTETHFALPRRDRMGRTITFLARIMVAPGRFLGKGVGARGLAVAEGTAVLVYPDPKNAKLIKADVVGRANAYFLSVLDNNGKPIEPEVCKAGKALTYKPITVRRVPNGKVGFSFLLPWTQDIMGVTQRYTVSVNQGVATSAGNQGGPNNLY